MTLIPARYTISLWENTTFRRTITVLTGATGSSPRDLTDYSAIMTMYVAPDVTPTYTLSTTNGQITLGGASGTLSLYIPAADTGTLPAGLVYELIITAANGTGDSDALLFGPVRVLHVP